MKAQITLYIIIGILLLAIVGSVLYFQRQILPATELPITVQIPVELQPIQAYFSNCLDQTTRSAIQQLGLHGGYIRHNFASNVLDPTMGKSVLDVSGESVPYWWFMSAANTCEKSSSCTYTTQKPSIKMMQDQISQYVLDNLNVCFQDFGDLRAQGWAIALIDSPTVTTTVTPDSVYTLLDQKTKLIKGDKEFSLNQFFSISPVKLSQIYDVSGKITDYEANNNFFEKATMELIAGFSSRNSDMLPPLSDIELEPGPGTFWVLNSVENNLKQILQSYVPLLQLEGTENYQYINGLAASDPALYEVIYNRNFLIPISAQGLDVRFDYLGWRPYFDLNCRGQLCRPEIVGMDMKLFPFNMKRYSFAYDLSYPILVSVTDTNAFGGRGFTFRFMLEQNMRNNNPLNLLYSQPVPVLSSESMMCDNPLVNATINNLVNGQPINATVYFACGETCVVGDKLPKCLNAYLTAEAMDAYSTSVPISTDTDEPKTINITLYPITKLNASINTYVFKKSVDSWFLDTSRTDYLKPKENAIISLSRKSDRMEKPFSTTALLKGDKFAPDISIIPGQSYSQINEIELVPGKYVVNIVTMSGDGAVIEPKSNCVDGECIDIPSKPIVFNETTPWPSGSISFEWDVTPEMLKGKSFINFKTITQYLSEGATMEDMGQQENVNNEVVKNRELLEPVLT